MVTATNMNRLTERRLRMVRHLENHDLVYGIELMQLQEREKDPGLAYFYDLLEAAIVFTTIGVLESRKNGTGRFDP